jgi:hypothetical protein
MTLILDDEDRAPVGQGAKRPGNSATSGRRSPVT